MCVTPQVDFLPAKALTPEDLARQQEILAARSRNLRNVVTVVDGNQTNFEIFIEASYKCVPESRTMTQYRDQRTGKLSPVLPLLQRNSLTGPCKDVALNHCGQVSGCLTAGNVHRSKGGYFFDIKVTYEERETSHRVIIGKEYYEDFDLQPEQVLDRAFAYLLAKKVQRQTEGDPLFVRAACCSVCELE